MTEREKIKRTETVSIRLDPKLRYMAEIGARIQRRSLSSFIEWAVANSVDDLVFAYRTSFNGDTEPIFLREVKEELYDVDEADRLVKLALRNPSLLNHEQQLIWKLVRENPYFWKGSWRDDEWFYKIEEDKFLFERLREWWDQIQLIAQGKANKEVLPKREPPTKITDIPF